MAETRRLGRLAPTHVFVGRLLGAMVFVLVLVAASLAVGMWGYSRYFGLGWPDNFENAAMILGGMGPIAQSENAAGKVFAGAYALYCGLFLVVAAGIVLSPVMHRLLHWFHIDDAS